MWGQKAPPKRENGGKKRPQNHKVGAESAPAQIRAEKSVGAKSAVKMQKWGQKAPSKQQSDGKKRHHSDKREKSHGLVDTLQIFIRQHNDILLFPYLYCVEAPSFPFPTAGLISL